MPELTDLRSDTVTKPSAAMRKIIADAPVGDDQFGEDPSVNKLQEEIAGLFNKEAALWFPTGTMANQVALRTLTRPGDDVIVSRECHAVWHETGASAANSGVQFTEIGEQGTFSREDFKAACKPRGHIIYPPTTLVEIENTHNRAGGIVFPQEEADAICQLAASMQVATFLDGARIWNASVASGLPVSRLAQPFDLVSAALSKGLGAPGGSLLAGSKEIISKAIRYRRMFGGAMRQAGIFAAAGSYAIKNNLQRLEEDHANAKMIAKILAQDERVNIDLKNVHTNIIVFHVTDKAPDAAKIVSRAKEEGVLIFAFGPRTIRAVTHPDVSEAACKKVAEILLKIISE